MTPTRFSRAPAFGPEHMAQGLVRGKRGCPPSPVYARGERVTRRPRLGLTPQAHVSRAQALAARFPRVDPFELPGSAGGESASFISSTLRPSASVRANAARSASRTTVGGACIVSAAAQTTDSTSRRAGGKGTWRRRRRRRRWDWRRRGAHRDRGPRASGRPRPPASRRGQRFSDGRRRRAPAAASPTASISRRPSARWSAGRP